MKLQTYQAMGLAFPELDKISLNASERAVLRKAATLLEQVRTLRNERVPVDWYLGEEDDLDLVFGHRICDELATKGEITAEAVR